MVLRYMVSDIDLVNRKIVQPKKEVVQPKEIAPPKQSVRLPRRRLRLWLLLIANVILWTFFYYLWGPPGKNPIWEFFTINRKMVTGIIYNAENPCAIVRGKVVHEGDTINGYKVVKIHRDKVEFEKKGKTITKQVHR